MRTSVTDLLSMKYPIFAFSHSRYVVAEVTNAGGFGVFGAARFTPDELDRELTWIDEHVNGASYGVDIVLSKDAAASASAPTREGISDTHRSFVAELLDNYGIDHSTESAGVAAPAELRLTPDLVPEAVQIAMSHHVKLIACALSVPSSDLVDEVKSHGIVTAALVGSPRHAVRQLEAGMDVLVAQGYEAGGHTGDIGSMVLVPAVIETAKAIRPVPVLAAGGIVCGRQIAAALSLGAAGVWMGSVWLSADESEAHPIIKQKLLAAGVGDTLRSPARTGKLARQLHSPWHDAWSAAGSPPVLPRPLQGLLAEEAMKHIQRAAENGNPGALQLMTYFMGQGVGLIDTGSSVRGIFYRLLEELGAAAEDLTRVTVDSGSPSEGPMH